MRSPCFLRSGLPILLLALLCLGCGEPRSPSGPQRTIQKDALALKRPLLVCENDSSYFGSVLDVAPAMDGRIYVADANAGPIKGLRSCLAD